VSDYQGNVAKIAKVASENGLGSGDLAGQKLIS
jgi:hypothetical protein